MSNPKRILLDLQTELTGELLSETVEVRGRKFEMRLLNDEESGWVFGLVNFKSNIALALESRRSTLAVGIRSIDGCPISEIYAEDWEALVPKEDADEEDEDVKTQESLLQEHGSLDCVFASFFLEGFLKKVPSSFVNELHAKWDALEKRRADAQGELKNSSREDSEKAEKPSSTESSQDGES